MTLTISTPWPITWAEKLPSCTPRSSRLQISRTCIACDGTVGPRVLQATVAFAAPAPVPSNSLAGMKCTNGVEHLRLHSLGKGQAGSTLHTKVQESYRERSIAERFGIDMRAGIANVHKRALNTPCVLGRTQEMTVRNSSKRWCPSNRPTYLVHCQELWVRQIPAQKNVHGYEISWNLPKTMIVLSRSGRLTPAYVQQAFVCRSPA